MKIHSMHKMIDEIHKRFGLLQLRSSVFLNESKEKCIENRLMIFIPDS